MQSTDYRPRLKELRPAAGLTRWDLATLIGVDRTTLRAWEQAHVPIPEWLLDPLADRFGVTVVWLMRWEELIDGLLSTFDENVG